MRKLQVLLAILAGPALAQQPNGTINAPIYATGYISQVGGTNVTTDIKPSSNHPTNLNIYTTGAISGIWTIKLPNPAFEGQILSFSCGGSAAAISIASSDGSTVDSNLPTACVGASTFAAQFDQRNNIWRYIGYGNTASIIPSQLPAFTGGDCTTTAGSVVINCGYGTGIKTALGTNIGTVGAPVVFNGAGGTPSSINLSNGTNLPNSALPSTIMLNGAPNVGPLNIKPSSAGLWTSVYIENYSATDNVAGPVWNTPTYLTLRDLYQGTRGANHGNAAYAGDGNGPTIAFDSWSRTGGGGIVTAGVINAGLQGAGAGAECTDFDFNGYISGTYQGLFSINGCGPGYVTTTPSIVPASTGVMDVGMTTRRWRDGWFSGAVSATGVSATGNSYLTNANVTNLLGNSGAPTVSACGTGSPAVSSDATTLSGMVTTGSGATTTCTLTWAAAKSTKPQCVISSETGATLTGYTPSTSGLVITFASAAAQKFTYICTGY
jgi:hypothetical protein